MLNNRTRRILNLALLQNLTDSDIPPSDVEEDTSESEYFPSDDSNQTEKSFAIEPVPPIHISLPKSTTTSNEYVFSTESTPTTSIFDNIHKPNNTRVRRKHQCLYCFQKITNFARHLERNHSDELQVQEILSHERQSKKRKKLIDKLRREGDFSTANIIPVMRCSEKSESDYIACKFCRGYYASKSLRRHAKKCFFNPDPSIHFKAQIEGQTLMCGPFGPNDPLKTSGLLNLLRADDVSLVAKRDKIICEVGRRYIKSHKEKHLLLVAKRYMRRLARLLISVRKLEGKSTIRMIDILQPCKFQNLIKATRDIAVYDEKNRNFKSPSLALQMGTLIKNATNTAYSIEIQKLNHSKEQLEQLKALITLIETDWAHEISSEAGQALATNKFNKPTLIPMAEDIKRMGMYLTDLISAARTCLVENDHNLSAFRNLLDGIFCSVMVFNKRRVGELQRMTLETFLKNHDTMPSSEFEKALTDSEKILYRSLKRIVIRGKRGRGVPVLFDKQTLESTEFLINIRQNFDLEDNPYLFGLPGTKNPITGYAVMKKHATCALAGNKEKAALLTSTRLRKHLATITQIFKMDTNELEQLARFMGHTGKTHAEFYRLPDDVYQTAKVSKLLLLSKKSSLFEQYKGKPLNEIEIDDNLVEASSDEEEDGDNSYENVPLTEENHEVNKIKFSEKKENKKQRRKLVAWTPNQKKLTEMFFKNHIKRKIPPKKDEVLKLIDSNAGVFCNKTWPVIKVYVCNKYNK